MNISICFSIVLTIKFLLTQEYITFYIGTIGTTIVKPKPREEEPKLNCLPEPEPKLRIAASAPAPAPFCLSQI